MQQRISIWALFLCFGILILGAANYPKWKKQYTEATISWDVSGYYLYLPALFIYQDLRDLEFFPKIMDTYRPATMMGQAFEHESGSYVMKYPLGQAIAYSPWFALGHFYAKNSAAYPADGFSYPYQVAISWGSLLMAFFGLTILRLVLLRFFSDGVTAIVLLSLVLSTNYLNYAAIDFALTHNYLFTYYALLLYAVIRWYEQPTWGWSILIALCLGLAALTRPTEIIACLIPVLWGWSRWSDWTKQWNIWQPHLPKLIGMILLVGLLGSLQLIYWKYASGDWIVYSYQDQGFSWLNPHVKNVLFSARKGWLVYTPYMALSLVGFFFWYRNQRPYFWAIFLFSVLNFWIVSAWDIWWYGGSFGQRAMVQSYALLALPLGAFWTWVLKKNWSTGLFGLITLGCVWLNVLQTWQAHKGILDPEYMTKAYYWRTFGKTEMDPRDKFLLDIPEDYRGPRREVTPIGYTGFEPDTTAGAPLDSLLSREEAYAGVAAARVITDIRHSKGLTVDVENGMVQEGKWVRATARFLTPKKEYRIWN
ncbi:MAG: hypothetical protein AAGH79_11515, partial [Bacteroidota bacterium]